MRPGIRLQLLLALAGLMVLAFVPLFFAVASLTQTTLRAVQFSHARSLGRSVAIHVSEARTARTDHGLQSLLDSEIGSTGLDSIAVYSHDGYLIAKASEPDVIALVANHVPIDTERTQILNSRRGPVLEILVPGSDGPVAALVRVSDEAGRVKPLLRLVALYVGVFALALIVFAYMALTRLMVRPIDELSLAARRVSDGARTLPIPRSGPREIAQLAASFAEMTQRLREEEQALRAKVDELQSASDNLKNTQNTLLRSERLASVGRLAAGLAHEIGNPLAAILGFEDLLLAGGLEPDEQNDFLLRMKKETERINRVLRQLLDFARPAASCPTLESEGPCSVAEVVQEVLALLHPHKAFRSVKLTSNFQDDLPAVALPPSQLSQVVLNLLLNAADATGPGGLVSVRARCSDIGVRIEVQDNGPGIRQDVRDNLFEPFVTTKDVGAGTGLGLAICRGLVEAVGGSIAAKDAAEGGALFVLDLPRAPLPLP